MVTQLDGAATFILNIDYTNLKMSKEDFDKNVKEAKRKI